MVALPLFKLASLFVRHVSKYGANRIKIQAHEHPRFREFAAKYGQIIHQINMRTSVALLRNVDAEIKAKEKAETPTVKTKEQIEKEEQRKAKQLSSGTSTTPRRSVWRRHFRPLPEGKAVDLFADVAGDAFVLIVATALILFEWYRSSAKPDKNAERLKELTEELEKVKQENEERKQSERKLTESIIVIEDALRAFRDPKTKQPVLSAPTAVSQSRVGE